MRFNLLVAAAVLQSMVSALPLRLSELGEINTRSDTDLWPELIPRRSDQWELSIRKHNPPTIHWGLYLHLAGQNHGGIICDARSMRYHMHNPGVSHLQVDCFADTHHDHDMVTLTHVGSLGSETGKEKAMKLLASLRCDSPHENCADYVLILGGKALYESKIIDQSTWMKIECEYNTHEAATRQTTSRDFNRPKPANRCTYSMPF